MELLKYFHKLTIYPENAKKLKGLILDLAVRGKLTEEWRSSNPNFECPVKLLTKVREEKQRLFPLKKNKKEESLGGSKEDLLPFNIPDTWIWTRLVECGFTQTGSTPPSNNLENFGDYIPFIGPGDISANGLQYSNNGLSKKGSEIGRIIPKGSLMMVCIGGSIGKNAINEIDVSCNQQINTITPFVIPCKYLKHVASSTYFQTTVLEKASGSATPIINKGKWENISIPMPPLEEQNVIVEKIELLFKEVEALEKQTQERLALKEKFGTATLNQLVNSSAEELAKNWSFTQKHFHTFFNEEANIKKLRETILQLAVQGKLTADWRKQNPDVEPASELLKSIKAEKEKLIAEKKIKKETPLPPISEEEKPYELPEGWEWCRLNDLGNIVGGGTPSMDKKEYWGGDIPWISPKDMKENFISDSEMKVTEEGVQNSSTKLIPRGSILLVVRSGILKRKLPVSINTVECTVNQDLKVVVPYLEFSNRFIHLLLLGLEKVILSDFVKFGMTVHSLKYEEFASMPIPLPPAREQHAILEKVNNLMSLCDELETQVKQSKEEVERLMEAVLKEVFEVREEVESL